MILHRKQSCIETLKWYVWLTPQVSDKLPHSFWHSEFMLLPKCRLLYHESFDIFYTYSKSQM